VAAEFLEKGYANVKVLGGGLEGWQKAEHLMKK
jgi:rhodanese-related sulfurtransferase